MSIQLADIAYALSAEKIVPFSPRTALIVTRFLSLIYLPCACGLWYSFQIIKNELRQSNELWERAFEARS